MVWLWALVLPPLASAALVVERVGDGSHNLNSDAQPVFLEWFSTNGTPLNTLSFPFSATRPTAPPYSLLEGGSSASDGQLTRSVNGLYIQVPGYNATNQEPSITSSLSLQVLRTIGLVSALGAVDTSRSVSMLTGSNFRSVVSVDGTAFWAAGQAGMFYVIGNSATPLSDENIRVINIFNGQLYCSKGGTTPGIYTLGVGLQTNGLADTLLALAIPGVTPSPFAFQLNTAGNVCYIADERDLSGVMRFSLVNGNWVSNYTIGTGTTAGARGLTVDWSRPGVPVIYATTTEPAQNRLIRISDTGVTSVADTIAIAPSRTAFRGLDFLPMPAVWLSAANGNWSAAGSRPWTNWSVALAAGSHVVFQDVNTNAAPLNLSVTNNTTFNWVSSLAFTAGYGTGAGTRYTVQGNALSLSEGIVSETAATQTIRVPLTFTGPQSLRTGSGDLVLESSISGDVALTKNGAGTLFLSATNRFTGSLAVQEGALSISGVITNSSLHILNATLAGTGRVHGPVLVLDGGNLDPAGSSLGTFTINGPLTLRGNVNLQISKAGTNCLSDLITGVSALSYGGNLNVILAFGILDAGDHFTLFNAGAYSDTFATVNLPAPGPGLYWDTSALSASGSIQVRRAEPPVAGKLSFIWDGTAELSFSGTPGLSYSVWGTLDGGLSPTPDAWLLLGSGIFPPSGMAIFSDPYVAWLYSQRFYRLSCP